MKSSAPWSVKGIERDARETAKEAAKRQGMTVGEWLNQVIYSAGDPEPSDGDIEGLKLRDLVTAIEHLHKRLAEADVKSNDAIGELTRQFGGVVERVQLLERVKPAEGSYDDLAARLKKIEEKGGDRQRVDALRALEKAVGQVAVQFNNAHKESLERLDATEQQVQSLGERIDGLGDSLASGAPAGADALKSAVEDLTERVAHAETIAEEAAKLRDDAMTAADPSFVERTGERLRVLGDEIKRGGDQIRTLETALSKISDQIEAAEKRSADGVQKVTETITELRQSFSAEAGQDADNPASDHAAIVEIAVTAARQTTESQIGAIQSAVRQVAERLEAFDPPTSTGDAAAGVGEASENTSGPEEIAPLSFDIEEHDASPEQMETHPAPGADEQDDAQGAGSEKGEDEGDDPFSFSENDFAALTEEPEKSEAAGKTFDDFAFDLDDDETDNANAKKESAAADDPMAEIADPSTPASKYDDLDDILADLDPTASSSDAGDDASATQPQSQDEPASDSVMGLAASRPSEISRRLNVGDDEAGKEDAASDEDDNKDAPARPTRRNLTAKQKAILAARARQKRKAAIQAGGQTADRDAADRDAADKTMSRPHDSTMRLGDAPLERDFLAQEEDDDPSADDARGGVAQSTINWVKARFARNKTANDDAANQEPGAAAFDRPDRAEKQDGFRGAADASAMAGIKATAGARPVTLALAGAIVLALGALFFLVKDILFKPDASAPAPIATQTPTTQSDSNAPGAAASLANAGAADGNAASASDAAALSGDGVVNPRALYLESIAALNAADAPASVSAAIQTLEEAAALGHPPAQLQLGELYKTGQGVEQDLGQARIWFRRSANGGNVLAMHRIGVMTARGDGGPADAPGAVSWFERAANRGLVDSQYNLGAIYHPTEGGGGLQDAAQAYYWYSLAARNGDTQAEPLAAGVSGALSSTERQEIDRRVTAWRAEEPNAAANEVSPAE